MVLAHVLDANEDLQRRYEEEGRRRASEVPDGFLCPISQLLMEDPVMADDGMTYERSMIEEWLSTHNTSPVTRAVLTNRLVPNRNLRSAIKSWRRLMKTDEAFVTRV